MFKFRIAYKVGNIWVEESINFAIITEGLEQRLKDVGATHVCLRGIEKWKP